MNRRELDEFVAHFALDAAATGRVLAHAHAKPDAMEVRQLRRRFLVIGGVVSLLAGIVFFVAANWDAINDESGYTVPADLMAWSKQFTRHLS